MSGTNLSYTISSRTCLNGILKKEFQVSSLKLYIYNFIFALQVLAGFDHFIFAFFAIEMCIKITAMGLYGKDTYLAETWNRLDMFIVIAG